MTECTYAVSVKVLSTTLTERVDLNNRANGLTVLDPLVLPDEEPRQSRLKSARAHGSYVTGVALDDDGTIVVSVRIDGSSWGQVATRQEAMRSALRTDARRFVEVAIEGVTRRWFSDGPVSIRFSEVTSTALQRHSLRYEVRFTVQPNPTVTIGA